MERYIFLCLALLMQSTFGGSFPQPPGLQNCGNTCFINSIVQCLNRIDSFVEYIIYATHPFANYVNRTGFYKQKCAYHLIELLKLMRIENIKSIQCKDTLKNFTQSVYAAGNINPWSQDDAESAMRIIFESLSSYWRFKDRINEFFNFQLFSRISCPSMPGFRPVEKLTREIILPLPIITSEDAVCKNLSQCFSNFVQPEELSDYIPRGFTQPQPCKKQLLIENETPYLLIMLKRYTYDPVRQQPKKIADPVDIPLQLKFPNNIFHHPLEERFGYELTAFAYHSGTLKGGHYRAFVKKNNQYWYECDDTKITEIGLNSMTSIPEGKNRLTFIQAKNTAYFYVYKRTNIVEKFQLIPSKHPLISTYEKLINALKLLDAHILALDLD